MNNPYQIDDKYIKLAIALKVNELKREQLSSLTYELVETALLGKWEFEKPKSTNKMIDDIVHLNANEVVAYLSTLAMISAPQMNIHDFDDLLVK